MNWVDFYNFDIINDTTVAYLNIDKTKLINLEYALKREVIRTNRSGAYGCTTIIDCNTRKYHGLLICQLPQVDGGRHVLLSGVDETIIQYDSAFNLGLHKYAGDNYEPKGHKYIRDFSSNPIPRLEYRVGGVVLSKEKILVHDENQLLIKYTLLEAKGETRIRFKPFLAFRNIHALSKANLDVNTKFTSVSNGIASKLYEVYPQLFMQFNKPNDFIPAPDWYYNIEYIEDQKRGYDYKEDLFVPGYFEIPVKQGETIIFSTSLSETNPDLLVRKFNTEIKIRIPRVDFDSCLTNSVQQFFIYSNEAIDIIAGFPWLPVRSRDALIALPGLTLPFNDENAFKLALKTYTNRFEHHLLKEIPGHNNSLYPLDIPLWFIRAVQQFGIRYGKKKIWKLFGSTIFNIILGYFNEKKWFEVDKNGLLYSHQSTLPNSWMTAWFNDKLLVERKGFLVEANALWFNALNYILEFKSELKNKSLIQLVESTLGKINTSFISTFWNDTTEYLNDYVTSDAINSQFRPNQLFACSLPYVVLNKHQIKIVLEKIRSELLTPFGIRSLSPSDVNYIPIYKGDPFSRENSAFNGSAWPWLLTPYFEAWLKVQPEIVGREAIKYLMNFEEELQINGICSISELYHGNPPQKAKGAISFAKNTGELIRLKHIIDDLK